MSVRGWDELEGRAPRTVALHGTHVGRGSLVRLRPRSRPGADVLDVALAGRTAVVESIQQDLEGTIQLAVVVEDDPGRDLGIARQPGHRFFFALDEVEPLPGASHAPGGRTALVAGIGNVLLGDDGFGVELARLLAQRELPLGVKVADFGIRGIDLAYELQEDYDAAILLDALPRGGAPGTLVVVEHDPNDDEGVLDPHGMSPLRVLGLARALGALPPRILVVGCEPAHVPDPGDAELAMDLSPPVRDALERAVALVESLLGEVLAQGETREEDTS